MAKDADFSHRRRGFKSRWGHHFIPSIETGELRVDLGRFLASGYYGETYEVDGGTKVLKIGIMKAEIDTENLFKKLDEIKNLDSDAFVQVFDYGVLCDVDLPQSKYIIKSGIAYYYMMEKLLPIPAAELKIATRTVNDLEDLERKPGFEQALKKYIWSKGREYKRDGEIEEGGSNPLEKAIDLFKRLRAAGARHHDMHKENIMQDPDGNYKLIDLESAKLLHIK